MNKAILLMLDQYQCRTDDDYENALKEIMQQIALLGLWRAKFFEYAAFYGGTSLRILYGLDRFSEDLDFSLLLPNENFKLDSYLQAIKIEMAAFGFETEISLKEKKKQSAIQSAFLKANTQQHLISINAPAAIQARCHGRTHLKIKIDIDVDPPANFATEVIPILRPIPFWVKSYTQPSLFAGKIAALLCRQWKLRVKGRDWYDFLWFIQRETPVNLQHLETRLRDVDYYKAPIALTEAKLKQLLFKRIEEVDLDLAKQDIERFIKEQSDLAAWSKPLFHAAAKAIRVA